ncbi:MAG TPA: hypothetical protein VKU41_22540 [Polyangiaceae bacterium]|nr:hypothetical protein [Polyangiaceae bacterium]
MAWLSLSSALVVGHLVGDVVWIGALLAANDLLSRAPWMAEPAEVGALARRVYQRLAQPALLLCLATGGVLFGLSPGSLLHARWFFAKMAFALALIVLHRLVGARAARIADGRTRGGAGSGLLAVLVLLCATGAIALEVTKSLPRL